MWTVLWVDEEGFDHWSRYETKEDLSYDENLAPYIDAPDTMVFPPAADDLWMSGDFFSAHIS